MDKYLKQKSRYLKLKKAIGGSDVEAPVVTPVYPLNLLYPIYDPTSGQTLEDYYQSRYFRFFDPLHDTIQDYLLERYPLDTTQRHKNVGGTIRDWGNDKDIGEVLLGDIDDLVVQIASSYNFVVILLANGTIRTYGKRNYVEAWTVPKDVNEVEGNFVPIVHVACSDYHTIVLLSNGTLKAWGLLSLRQLEVNTVPHDLERVVEGFIPVVQVVCSTSHNIALLANGTIRAWGRSSDWSSHQDLWTVPEGVENVVQVVCSTYHTVALLADGTLRGWGFRNMRSLTEIPATLNGRVVDIQCCTNHNVALLVNGTLQAWGNSSYNLDYGELQQTWRVPRNLELVNDGFVPVVQVECQNDYTLALLANGTIQCWGSRITQPPTELTTIRTGFTPVVYVSVSYFIALAILADGTVRGWPTTNKFDWNIPEDLEQPIVKVAVVSAYKNLAIVSTLTQLRAANKT